MNIKELLEEETKLQNRLSEIKKVLSENKVYVVTMAYCKNQTIRDIDSKVFKQYEKAREYFISLVDDHKDEDDCIIYFAHESTYLIQMKDYYIE